MENISINSIRRSDRNNLVAAGFLLAGCGLLLLRVFDPATSIVFPPCPLHYFTGLYCPGCGSLRAMHQLLHGNLREAWALNPLAVLLLPFVAYGLTSEALRHLRGYGLPRLFIPAVWIRALGVAVILFGIARNLPLHPFNLLAPGAMLHP
ncbi:MAG: DUF2752 domain-containing protein [Candidatus Sulfotelmatobacter sp.]|jgi:hypothetical protein